MCTCVHITHAPLVYLVMELKLLFPVHVCVHHTHTPGLHGNGTKVAISWLEC